MKKIIRRLSAFLLALSLLTVLCGTASALTAPPTDFDAQTSYGYDFKLVFNSDAVDWLNAITGVTVNNESYTESGFVWMSKSYSRSSSSRQLVIGEGFSGDTAACVISAAGYADLTLNLNKSSHAVSVVGCSASSPQEYTITVCSGENGSVTADKASAVEGDTVILTVTPDSGFELDTLTINEGTVEVNSAETGYRFTMPAADVSVSADFKATAPVEPKDLPLDKITISSDYFGSKWYFEFPKEPGYAGAVTALSVNDTPWTAVSYDPSNGGAYYPDTANNRLTITRQSYGSTPTLKSGDMVTIQATGYNDLAFTFVIDPNGTPSIQPAEQSDPYQLFVKLEGSFEAVITGQKDVDGVSGATGTISTSKTSSVTVYGALVAADTTPTDDDWQELDPYSSTIQLDGNNCHAQILPNTEKGTPADADSGLEVWYSTIGSSVTLSGVPKNPGQYLVQVTISDDQGRAAVSNSIPLRVYSGEEALADQLVTENLVQTQDGKYMWDIMEPWAIYNFGSNVTGESETVRVPAGLKAWYGSHESGTYGYLGYDIPWAQVEQDSIPQTLYIPAGCNLTMVNMEVLSSVRIIVEEGGTLVLRDSVVQGIIEVKKGGTFSMNYNDFGAESGFLTGASVCGQLRPEDGAVLENAAIYSHANYLANGNLADRSTTAPVVVTTGNVTVKGQVFIHGDEAAHEKGQTGLLVKDGRLTLDDNAVLAVYGGGGTVSTSAMGGTAIQLDNGTITGNGSLYAVGGEAFWGNGGSAVDGKGVIHTASAVLLGSNANPAFDAVPGKAVESGVAVYSESIYTADGVMLADINADDPMKPLYWRVGIEAVPPLEQFPAAQPHIHSFGEFTVTKQPTLTEAGEKSSVCDGCGYTKTEIIPVLTQSESYRLTHADGSDYISYMVAIGQPAAFRSTAPLEKFIRVEVDEHTVSRDHYTLTEGSTIVTLKAEYVQTLPVGRHTLAIVSQDGSVSGEFTIRRASIPSSGTSGSSKTDTPVQNQDSTTAQRRISPQTGDNSPVNLLCWIEILSALTLAVTIFFRHRKFLFQ